MEKIIHDIKSEAKLVSMLGYNLIGPDKSNRWLVIDENNNQVGFIQYKKLFNKNDKKGYPATFGYCTKIDSSKISYKSTRKINNLKNRYSRDTSFSYELDIKRENGDSDHVEISMDELPHLNVWSKKYGFIDFKVDSEGLFLNFKSKTENFNVEELVIFKSNVENKPGNKNEYVYQIRYCDKESELSDDDLKGTTIREISGTNSQYYQGPNQLSIKERTWINGRLRTNRESEVTGTVQEMVQKHQMGIDAFNHFRFLINQILPFKQEVISSMIDYYKKEELALFIPELGAASEEMVQQSNYDHKESNWIKEIQEVASMLTREKSMELIDARKEVIEEKMKEIEKREDESEILGMLEDEDYDEEEWNMLLGTSRQSNSLKKNNAQEKTLVKRKKDSKTTE